MIKINRIRAYQKLPDSVKASMWFAICSILQKGIQFLTIPLFTRTLTTDQYGQFTLYQSWMGIISIFATLNLAAGVFNNGMVKFEDDRRKYISAMQGLSTITTLVVAMIYLIAKQSWDALIGLPTIIIFSMLIELIVSPALSFWSAKQRFEYKYKMLFFITIAISIISPCVGLVAVSISEQKGIARILSVSIINIISGIIFYGYNMWKGKCFFHKKYWGFALSFNLPLVPHYLSSIVLGQADRIMIGKFYGETEVAIYSLAYSVSLMMNVVTNSINASFVPWTYQQCKKKNFQKIGQISNMLLLLIAGLSLFPVLIAPELMKVLGPKEYLEGAYLIPAISISVFLIFLYGLFANIEFYFEQSKFIMFASIGAAILNIILNIVLFPILGYKVAAYTTLICYIAFSFAHYVFMKKVCKYNNIEHPIYNEKFILMLSTGLIIISHLFVFTYQFMYIRYVIIFILLSIFVKYRKLIAEKIQLINSK